MAGWDSHPLEIADFHGILVFRRVRETSNVRRVDDTSGRKGYPTDGMADAAHCWGSSCQIASGDVLKAEGSRRHLRLVKERVVEFDIDFGLVISEVKDILAIVIHEFNVH